MQDGLHRDEALSGDAGYLVRHDRNQRSPGREMSKVRELVISEVVHEQVSDLR